MSNDQTTVAKTHGGEGWSDIWGAARAQIALDPKRPLENYRGDLQAIQDQLLPGERVVDVRTLHQGGPGRATGAMAITPQRLLIADLSRSSTPVAETVLFSEIKGVSCMRRGPFGMSVTVRTRRGRRFRGLVGKDGASAKAFVAALRAQIDTPSAAHLREVPKGSVAAKPPTALARVQRALQLAQFVIAPVFPVAAIFVITGTTSNKPTQYIVAAITILRALEELCNAAVVRLRGGKQATEASAERIAII